MNRAGFNKLLKYLQQVAKSAKDGEIKLVIYPDGTSKIFGREIDGKMRRWFKFESMSELKAKARIK